MDNKLTIIIVTFQSEFIIENCLEKIDFDKFSVFVVDNNSKDNTVKIIEEHFPKVNLVKLEKNIGYGRANNMALRQVKTPYALILNPDAFISVKDINIVLENLENNKNIAIAGPNISEDKNDFLENSAIKKKSAENDLAIEKEHYIKNDFISGSVLFLKMKIFREIGFFDENIFLFYEDDEICFRSRTNGYLNVIIPQASAFHAHGKSSPSTLRNLYKKSWHLYWSRCYFEKLKAKSKFKGKEGFCSFTLLFRCFIKLLTSLFSFDSRKIIKNSGYFFGVFSFLIGIKAFKENGISRG